MYLRRNCTENATQNVLTNIQNFSIDILMNTFKKKNLMLIVSEGEGQRIEFKEKLSRLNREFVAFANAAGGSIFVGIDDKGKIKGNQISNKDISEIYNIARNCDPSINIETLKYNENVFEIIVQEGVDKPYRCKEGFFLRVGPNTQKLKRDEIRDIIIAEGRFHFDEVLNKHFQFPQDFDRKRLNDYINLADIRFNGISEDILCSMNVAEKIKGKLYLNQAGVLFFAKIPQQFIKESYISCIRYQGYERFGIIDRQEIYGDLIVLIEDALKFIKRNIKVKYSFDEKAQRREIYEYPIIAVREAVTNAVMHRDYYYDASHIYIHVFADRLEIENPGGLLHGLKIEDLGNRSVRRNRTIADLLFRAKYIERIGSGIQRMRRALELNNNPPMEITATNFFVVKLYPRVDKEESLHLTPRQNHLFQFIKGKGRITKREASLWLKVSDDTALREIKALLEKDLIIKSGTGKSTVYILK